MSYQKQKESNHSLLDSSDLQSMCPQVDRNEKKKKIKKQSKNTFKDDQGLSSKINIKKKQMAKQIKRLREQNRRANHKQYVTNLQQQIKNKELQIQKLQTQILQLQERLKTKNCNKCGSQLSDVTNSPFLLQKQPTPVSSQEIQFQLDQSYRRITDESSLKLCFGNKSFLFFLVTMCCLTIGSIADNPQIFLQPIYPYMQKSEMCFLHQKEKLNSFEKYGALLIQKKNQKILKFGEEYAKLPTIDGKIKRVSDNLDFKVSLFKIPSFMQLIPSLKDSTQLFFSFGTNQIFRRLLEGRNYYM